MKLSLVAFSCTVLLSSAARSEDVLSSAYINVGFSGSLNSVGGSGNLTPGQMELPAGSTLENLRFTLVDFGTIPAIAMPQSVGFSLLYRYPNISTIDGAGMSFSDVGGVSIGSTKTLSPFISFNLSNPFLGLIKNYGQPVPIIQGGASWSFGGLDVTGNFKILVEATGTLAAVPEPSIYLSFISGLLVLGLVLRKKGKEQGDLYIANALAENKLSSKHDSCQQATEGLVVCRH